MSETPTRIPVNTPSRSYDVVIGRGILSELGRRVRAVCGGSAACVISDSNVAALYGEKARASLEQAGYRASLVSFPAGEEHKRLSTLSELLEGVAQAELSRDDVVVALGGGVTGDMGGLAGALYLRGCKVVQVPTSLLAMADSSVGGKTAVDLEAGKNLAGVFLQPHLVLADIDCLDTLTPALFTDSCGEVIKHGVIGDAALFDEIAEDPINQPGFPRGRLQEIVARNVEIKRDVVNQDERERGLRQTLNFGHTIGHAIEAASGFALGHGSCVAAGMCCIARASVRLGWCSREVEERIVSAVSAYGLPTDTQIDHDTLFSYIAHDKKRHGDSVNVVVPEEIGLVRIRRVGLDELFGIIELGCGV